MDSDYEDEYTYDGIGIHRDRHFQRHNEGDNSDDEDGKNYSSSDDSQPIQFKKSKNNDDHIYGVFGESSDDDDERGRKGLNHHRRKKRKLNNNGKKEEKHIESVFVKSKVVQDKNQDSIDLENDGKIIKDNDNTVQPSPLEDKHALEEKVKEEKEQERQKKDTEEANAKFEAILARGKKGGNRQKPTSSNDAHLPTKQYYDTSNEHTEVNIDEYTSMQSGVGLGFQSASTSANGYPEDDNTTPSLSSFFSNSNKMAKFLGASNKQKQKTNESRPIKRDPSLGTWEKHTKGIGMKLLTKMGYKGSGGLGAKRLRPNLGNDKDAIQSQKSIKEVEVQERKGISRPVEVVVRPINLGLGYGSFKEATKLKSNQQIEAEVRGIDWEKKQAEEREKKIQEERSLNENTMRTMNLIPTAESLISAGNWRKNKSTGSLRKKKKEMAERKMISYQDVIGNTTDSNEKNMILDLRGPTAASISFNSLSVEHKRDNNLAETAQLGEELLHNVTFLINSYENKLHSSSHFVQSSRNKASSLRSDVDNLKQRRKTVQGRRLKLKNVLTVIDKIELFQKDNADLSHLAVLIQSLNEHFSIEEKKTLQYYETLIPSLIGPVIEHQLEKWSPLSDPLSLSKDFFCETLTLCSKSCPKADGTSLNSLRRFVLHNHLLPRIKKAFQSSKSKWNPVADVEIALQLHEMILDLVKNITTPKMHQIGDNDDNTIFLNDTVEDHENNLCIMIQDSIMFDVIYPKLCRALSNWTPEILTQHNEIQVIANLPHLWILPWLPHLEYKSMLMNLLPDIKRKLTSSIKFASKVNDQNISFLQMSLTVIKHWRGIIDQRTLQAITSDHITPRLSRYLSNISITPDSPSEKDVEKLRTLKTFFNEEILSRREYLSLVEGEILSQIASTLYTLLVSNNISVTKGSEFYLSWRCLLLSNETTSSSSDTLSQLLLRQDTTICRIFYGCLMMIKTYSKSESDRFDDLEPPLRDTVNYKTVQARRAKEDRLREEEEMMRGNIDTKKNLVKTSSYLNGQLGATFKEVVEDFAIHNDTPFYPMSGLNNLKDGKHIFMFGNSQIYFDTNVVFALKEGHWRPTALEDLL